MPMVKVFKGSKLTSRDCLFDVQNASTREKSYWKRNGQFVQKLELTAVSLQDLRSVIAWFPNLSWLTLNKCSALLQTSCQEEAAKPLELLKTLETLEIQDVHLISEKALSFIPRHIKQLIIAQSRGFSSEFFDQLAKEHALSQLTILNSQGMQLNYLCNLPQTVTELDLSGCGKNIQPDALLYFPQALHVLKMNGWECFTDCELKHLPATLHALEIEGWQVTNDGLKILQHMPLESLNLAHTSASSIAYLPRSLKRLNLSHVKLTTEDLDHLKQFKSLCELDLRYSSAPEHYPPALTRLTLSHCESLSRKSIRALKALHQLKQLALSGLGVENSDLEWLPPNLEVLDLSYCNRLTDVALMQLFGQKQLVSLHLDGCEQIRGFGLSCLHAHLKKLSLSGLNRLSGKCLVQLPKYLQELCLDSCELVTTGDIKALPSTIQVLSLKNCPQIDNKLLDKEKSANSLISIFKWLKLIKNRFLTKFKNHAFR